jgi:integrase
LRRFGSPLPAENAPTVREYYDRWIPRKKPPDVRPSLTRVYASHFDHHLLELAGDWRIDQIGQGHLLWLRAELRKRASASNRNRGRRLSEKTIRNMIDGSLRALCRDARRVDQLDVSLAPFEDVAWTKSAWEPTPFSEKERDRILAWYETKLWRVPGSASPKPWPAYRAYVYTLFFTGCRPSELSAVRCRNVNLTVGTLRILESIVDRELGDVKTRSSDRTVRLTEENVALLRKLRPRTAPPGDFFFTDVRGRSIEGGAFYNTFVESQRVLGISPVRDLYSTKDTYISVCLSAAKPVNLSWLSDQTGVSESTIKKHYGRFMHHPDRDALELRKIKPPQRAGRPRRVAPKRASSRRKGTVWTSIGPRRPPKAPIPAEIGGDGWESNPPRTLSALIRF